MPVLSLRTNKGSLKGERLQVKAFTTCEGLYRFLKKGDNDRNWRICDPRRGDPIQRGTYAWAGGAWHNVKDLDPSVLAHI